MATEKTDNESYDVLRAQKRLMIRQYVLEQRKEKGVTKLSREPLPELSGFAHGEDAGLFRQLLCCEETSYTSWHELDNPDVLDLMYQYVSSASPAHVNGPRSSSD